MGGRPPGPAARRRPRAAGGPERPAGRQLADAGRDRGPRRVRCSRRGGGDRAFSRGDGGQAGARRAALQDIRSYFDQIGEDHTASLQPGPAPQRPRGASVARVQPRRADVAEPAGEPAPAVRDPSEDDQGRSPPTAPPPHGTGAKGAKPTTTTARVHACPVRSGMDRYLSQDPPSQTVTTSQAKESADFGLSQSVTSENDVTDRESLNPAAGKGCDVVTDRNPPAVQTKVVQRRSVSRSAPPIQTVTTSQAKETAAPRIRNRNIENDVTDRDRRNPRPEPLVTL